MWVVIKVDFFRFLSSEMISIREREKRRVREEFMLFDENALC